ncbi:tetratricopeptide repeat-containing sensor histidine kinase [Psychroserpens damuponensis]|uniref:tetratricopeptide repeat-containing sensor histidine kinase n=1 Tax=Psychroserpens damuponensis TaxID=943936 RepID=UPI0006945682|nr:tetratricopeptide repeat protein [Psychroserpens damuponensis]
MNVFKTHGVILSAKFLLATCICFLLSVQSLLAQDDPNSFKQDMANLEILRPKNFSTLDSIFKKHATDSLKMKSLIKASKTLDYVEGESYGLNALGVIYRNISHYEASIATHKKANALAVENDNLEFKIISLNNIGVVYRRMDLVKPALDFHTKALDFARSVENPSQTIAYNIAVSQNSIGNIYLILEQYELALKQFEKSLEIEKALSNRLGLAINYQNIGYAYESQGDLNNALRNYKLSLEFNEQINSNLGRVICYNSIGQVYIKQKKYIDAKIIIEKALQKALKINDQFYIAASYINLGWVQKEMGKLIASEDNLKKGLEVAKQFNLNLSIVEADKHLSELYDKTNNYEAALNHYKESVAVEKTINNDRNLRYVNDVIIQFENEAKNNEIKALATENQVWKTKLERNKKVFWYSMLVLAIIVGVLVALYRTRQLSQEKQILTLEQDMLRSQMNPHFIFNSLNSIKLYIINNEKENAVYYLNKFSKLIRKILVASSEKENSLEDELDTMRLYMNIENIRFSNEIDFDIHVDDNINTANIKLPSLVLQPFLENALWHGLSSKKEDKKIKLHVYRTEDEFVMISIKDNGIGRVQSEKINKDKLIKRKSVGIAITKARLANFSKDYTHDYHIDIEDLYDDNKIAIGTNVIVKIPTRSNVLRTA